MVHENNNASLGNSTPKDTLEEPQHETIRLLSSVPVDLQKLLEEVEAEEAAIHGAN